MKIGICTTDYPVLPGEELFAVMNGAGVQAVQLNFGTLKEAEYVADGRYDIPAAVPEAAVEAVAEGCARYHMDLVAINGTFNMAHPDAQVRMEGLRRFALLAGAARRLGCPVLTLCSGTRNEAHLWRTHPANVSAQAWADMMDTMGKALEIAAEADLTLAIETEASNVIDTPEKARRVMDAFENPRLRMIMDCANLFHAGTAHRENVEGVMRHAFAVFGEDVVIAHGKDIRAGDGIDFCAAGEGIVDFELFLRLLRQRAYAGPMILHGCKRMDAIPGRVRWMRGVIEELEARG